MLPVVTRPFAPFLPLLSTPAPRARFLVLTVGRGWHLRPRIRSVDPFEIVDVWETVDGISRIYRVRWLGYNPNEDTWEPEENLPKLVLFLDPDPPVSSISPSISSTPPHV
jgi:hypothetical protein